jgi:hypothetical protein
MPIIRIERPNALRGKLTTYQVLLNHQPIGSIKNAENKEFEIALGSHTLLLYSSALVRTSDVHFFIQNNQTITFKVVPKPPQFKTVIIILALIVGNILTQQFLPEIPYEKAIKGFFVLLILTYCYADSKNNPSLLLQQTDN